MHIFRLTLFIVTALMLSSCGSKPNESAQTVAKTSSGKPYTYDKCIVIEQPLTFGGGPFTRNYDGREVKFCCRPCIKTFEANPVIWLAKLDRWDAGGAPTSSSAAQSRSQ